MRPHRCRDAVQRARVLSAPCSSPPTPQNRREEAHRADAKQLPRGSLHPALRLPDFREQGLRRITRRAEPVVAAIESYRDRHGQPPESLSALVPDYLPRIASTDVAAHPEFYYALPDDHSRFKNYELGVMTGYGLSFDRYVYWPEGCYPAYMYGGGTERIGDWAYVHE